LQDSGGDFDDFVSFSCFAQRDLSNSAKQTSLGIALRQATFLFKCPRLNLITSAVCPIRTLRLPDIGHLTQSLSGGAERGKILA
jgi:hypothetical protein